MILKQQKLQTNKNNHIWGFLHRKNKDYIKNDKIQVRNKMRNKKKTTVFVTVRALKTIMSCFHTVPFCINFGVDLICMGCSFRVQTPAGNMESSAEVVCQKCL